MPSKISAMESWKCLKGRTISRRNIMSFSFIFNCLPVIFWTPNTPKFAERIHFELYTALYRHYNDVVSHCVRLHLVWCGMVWLLYEHICCYMDGTCVFVCECASARQIRLKPKYRKLIKKILVDSSNKLFALDEGITILNYEIKGFAGSAVVPLNSKLSAMFPAPVSLSGTRCCGIGWIVSNFVLNGLFYYHLCRVE